MVGKVRMIDMSEQLFNVCKPFRHTEYFEDWQGAPNKLPAGFLRKARRKFRSHVRKLVPARYRKHCGRSETLSMEGRGPVGALGCNVVRIGLTYYPSGAWS